MKSNARLDKVLNIGPKVEIFGVAYHSPLIIYNLISPRSYYPILLKDESLKAIKEEVAAQKKRHSDKLVPIILACGLPVLHAFLKACPNLKCKVILFDWPGLLLPFFGPELAWLDCDHQDGGGWQIIRFKPELFDQMLTKLKPLGSAGRDLVTAMQRFVPDDKVQEINNFTKFLPKFYKELLAAYNSVVLGKEVETKQTRQKKGLNNLITRVLSHIPTEHKDALINTAVEYQLKLIDKKEFGARTNTITKDKEIKKHIIELRRWIESKAGETALAAYLDAVCNSERRTWENILSSHREVSEEDIKLLLVKQPAPADVEARYKKEYFEVSKLPGESKGPKTGFPELSGRSLSDFFTI